MQTCSLLSYASCRRLHGPARRDTQGWRAAGCQRRAGRPARPARRVDTRFPRRACLSPATALPVDARFLLPLRFESPATGRHDSFRRPGGPHRTNELATLRAPAGPGLGRPLNGESSHDEAGLCRRPGCPMGAVWRGPPTWLLRHAWSIPSRRPRRPSQLVQRDSTKV
jgi:hypothetical protein